MADLAKLLTAVADGSTVPSEHVDMMWATLVTGIVVVFLILVLLVFILWALGKVLNVKTRSKGGSAANTQPAAAQEVKKPVVSEPDDIEEYDEDDEEIIAVIAAAIAAYGEADGKRYRIASVKKREKSLRSNWSAAGISESTRPF